MDLYEALKAGTSSEDLLKKFHEELDAANARLATEAAAHKKQEEHEQHLTDCRTCLAAAIVDYCEVLLGSDNVEVSIQEMEEVLKAFEKDITNTWGFWDSFYPTPKKMDKKTPIEIKVSEDANDIFTRFLDSLK